MSGDDDFDVIFKIVIIGDSSVGKSNLLSRFTADQFNATSKATIGVEFATKTICIDGETVKAQLWDTAGQEKYRAITSVYYRNSAGALLVYDVTNADSFKNLIDPEKGWLHELKKNTDEDVSILLIGNKCDLSDQRQVNFDEVLAFASEKNLEAMETSALENTNVGEAFEMLIKQAYQKLKARKLDEPDEEITTTTTTTTTSTVLGATATSARQHQRTDILKLNSKTNTDKKKKKKCCRT